MGNTFLLTDAIMKEAVAYMPIEDKAELAKEIAKICVVDIPTADQNINGEKLLALPYLKGEDRTLKTLCLMNILLVHYLKIKLDKPLDEALYNYYAGNNLINQIERYKSNFELKNKAFDLLADYKEFKKFVDVEINNLIMVNNDGLARFTASVEIFSSPENFAKIFEELKKVSDKHIDKLKEKNIINDKMENANNG